MRLIANALRVQLIGKIVEGNEIHTVFLRARENIRSGPSKNTSGEAASVDNSQGKTRLATWGDTIIDHGKVPCLSDYFLVRKRLVSLILQRSEERRVGKECESRGC